MTRLEEIVATINEINNLSLLQGAKIKIIKCCSTAKFKIVVKIYNRVYYTDIWLSNYDFFDDVSKELRSYFELYNVIPSNGIRKLINKIDENPFYMDWNKVNGIYQLS